MKNKRRSAKHSASQNFIYGLVIICMLSSVAFLSACADTDESFGQNSVNTDSVSPASPKPYPAAENTTNSSIEKENDSLAEDEEDKSNNMPEAAPTFDKDFAAPAFGIRPVAVTIDNEGERPLPQAGISQAQIVYEIPTENRLTRYLAFFWGNIPEMVGPVRSARHYFLDWTSEFDAIYVHYGYSPQAKRDLRGLDIDYIDGLVHGEAFWDTDKNRANWQDSFTSAERLDDKIAGLGFATETETIFPFEYYSEFTIPETGDTANSMIITYGNGYAAQYEYKDETGQYYRTRNGKEQVDRNSNEQVSVRNVIVITVPISRIRGDREGRVNIQTVGTGKGWFFTAGKVRELVWEKQARSSQTGFTFSDGSPVKLNPGQTWIQIMPNDAALTMN